MTTINPTPISLPNYVDYISEEPPPAKPKKIKLTKAQRKERERQAMKEFKTLEVHDQLKREFEFSKKNLIKVNQKWKATCAEIKLKQMQEELHSWEAKTNRLLKQKDEKIALILVDLRETEEMHKRTFGKQLQMMDYLSDIFKAFQQNARLHYEAQVAAMLHDFYQETSVENENLHGFHLNCENVVNAKSLVMEQALKTDYNIFLDKRDDIANGEIVKRYVYRDAITHKMQVLQKQLQQFLDSLRNASLDAQKYNRVNSLMQRQRTFVIESSKLNSNEELKVRLLQELEKDLKLEALQGERKMKALRLEYAYILEMRRNIETQIKQCREETHDKLKLMSCECFEMCKKYSKLQKYGELLLSLSANCKKLQTEAEKVVAYADFQKPNADYIQEADETFIVQTLDLKSHVDFDEQELKAQMQLMKSFWQRQALAEAQNLMLEERKRLLLEENRMHIEKIKSLSKTDDASDLQRAVKVKCVLDEEPNYRGFNCKYV